jgi:uncharacterized protein
LRITADSNLYVSAFNFGGLPQRLLDLAEAGTIQLTISEPLIEEILDVLGRKFDWTASELRIARERIIRYAEIVTPSEQINAVPEDPDDDRILECAVGGRSDLILTGDKDLLRLGEFRGITIMRVADFLRRGLEQEGRAR